MSAKNPDSKEIKTPAPIFNMATNVTWDDTSSVKKKTITEKPNVKKTKTKKIVKKKKPGTKKVVKKKKPAPQLTLEQRRDNLYRRINNQMPDASQEERFYAFTQEADRLNLFLRQVKDSVMPNSTLTYRQQEALYKQAGQTEDLMDLYDDIDGRELQLADDYFFDKAEGITPAAAPVRVATNVPVPKVTQAPAAETPAPVVTQKAEEVTSVPQPVSQTVTVTPVAEQKTVPQKDSIRTVNVVPEKVVIPGVTEAEFAKVHKPEEHVFNAKTSNEGYYRGGLPDSYHVYNTTSTAGSGVTLNYVSKDSVYKAPTAAELEMKRNVSVMRADSAAAAPYVAPEKKIAADPAVMNLKVNKMLADAFIGRENDRIKSGKPGLMNQDVFIVVGVTPKSGGQKPYMAYMPLTLNTAAIVKALEASGGMGAGLLDHFYKILDQEKAKNTGYILFDQKFKGIDYNMQLANAPQLQSHKNRHIDLVKKVMETNQNTPFILPGYMQLTALKGATPALKAIAEKNIQERQQGQQKQSTIQVRNLPPSRITGKKVSYSVPQWSQRSVIQKIPNYDEFSAPGYTKRQKDSLYFAKTFDLVVGQNDRNLRFTHGMTNLAGFESAGWQPTVPATGSRGMGYWQFTPGTWRDMSVETGVTVPFTAHHFKTPEGIYAQHVNAKHYHNKKKAYILEQEQARIAAGKKPLLGGIYQSRRPDGSTNLRTLTLDALAGALWAGNDYYQTLERAVDGGSNVMPKHRNQHFGLYGSFWAEHDSQRLNVALEEQRLITQNRVKVVPTFYVSQIGTNAATRDYSYGYSTTADYMQQGQEMATLEATEEKPTRSFLRDIKLDTINSRPLERSGITAVYDYSSTAGGRTSIRYIYN